MWMISWPCVACEGPRVIDDDDDGATELSPIGLGVFALVVTLVVSEWPAFPGTFDRMLLGFAQGRFLYSR